MSLNLFASQTAVRLLGGTEFGMSGTAAFGAGQAAESVKVRQAKANFTTKPSTPPWADPVARRQSGALRDVLRMPTLIDRSQSADDPADIKTAFATYKVLTRLSVISQAASTTRLAESERIVLQAAFQKGLREVQSFLAAAEPQQMMLSFGKPARQTESVTIPATASSLSVAAKPVLTDRQASIPGIGGTERLSLSLASGTQSSTVTVDLAGVAQPITLDRMAAAFNAAIESAASTSGSPLPFASRFAVEKTEGKWGLVLRAGAGERVSLDQVDGQDALVVASGSLEGAAEAGTLLLRYGAPDAGFARQIMSRITATDRVATDSARRLDDKAGPVAAPFETSAILTDRHGFTFALGTSSGDFGANLADGQQDLVVSKFDSEGATVWRRSLGATTEAQGAALALSPDGGVVVTGSLRGDLSGNTYSDTDLLVARFDSDGQEIFARAYRALGDDIAHSVTVATDGAIFVAGQSGAGRDGFITKVDTNGDIVGRSAIDAGGDETVAALSFGANGQLLAIVDRGGRAELQSLDPVSLTTNATGLSLGAVKVTGMTVGPGTGQIAVAGSVSGANGSRDGAVFLIDPDLAASRTLSFSGAGADEIDSLAYLGGTLYAGGRTTSALFGARQGSTDGFIARIDPSQAQISGGTQFGAAGQASTPVRVAAATNGATITGALGLHRGVLNPPTPTLLVSETSLRPGDEFFVRVGHGAAKRIGINANDTLTSLAERIRVAAGRRIAVTTPLASDGHSRALRIAATAGLPVELLAGGAGKDALAKLGLEPARLFVPPKKASSTPAVVPGGQFGLALTDTLNLRTAADAKFAEGAIQSAISMTKTAYRSLYWDSSKARLVDGPVLAGLSPAQQSQLEQYNTALSRLTALSGSN